MNIGILGLSETRWPDSGEFNLQNGDILLYSGKPEGEPRESGVGIMISKHLKRSLIHWAPVSNRIITARFKTKFRNVNSVQCYSPTETATVVDKDLFYDSLETTLISLKKKDINIVMGDLNAKVGNDNTGFEQTMGKHGLDVMNDNGKRFEEFCVENRLVIGGTVFPHKNCHKVTWVSPDRHTQN